MPIGQYTQTILQRASADPSYGADFSTKVQQNVVSQQTDDLTIVAQVQLGEADAAVMYATDIPPQTKDQLASFPIHDAFNTNVAYPIATTKGDNPAGGQAFVNFVLSPAGQQVLATWNFLPPGGATPQSSPGVASPDAAGTGGAGAGAGGVAGAGGAAASDAGAPASAGVPAPTLAGSSTFSPTVSVTGRVADRRTLTLDDLMQLPSETVQESYLAGQSAESGSFTGTRLLNVLDATGGAVLPTDMNNAKLRVTVMVTGADGYQVALGWGELDPEFGGQAPRWSIWILRVAGAEVHPDRMKAGVPVMTLDGFALAHGRVTWTRP